MSNITICLCCPDLKTAYVFAEMAFELVCDLNDAMYMIRHDLIVIYNYVRMSIRYTKPCLFYHRTYRG